MSNNHRNVSCDQTPDALSEFRVYSFKEVAGIFFPNHDPRQASRNLNSLIKSDPLLYESLVAHGWRPGKRMLTPLQVGDFITYLGSPEEFREIVSCK